MHDIKVISDDSNNNLKLHLENERLVKENMKLKKELEKVELTAYKKISAYKKYLKYFNKKWDILSFDEIDYKVDKNQLTEVQLIKKYEGKEVYWELQIKDVETSGFILAHINQEIKDYSDILLSLSSPTFILVDVFKNKTISPLSFNKEDRVMVLGSYRHPKSCPPHIDVHSIEIL